METLQYVYTSQTEIERLMSQLSAELYVDDTGIGQATDPLIWTDVIYQATDTVNIYAQKFYGEDVLAHSSWVHRIATWIAAHFLTQRRGNPGTYSSYYDEAIALLERVANGSLQIPRTAIRGAVIPSMSNFTIDDRFPINKIRVQPSTSVGGTSTEQDLAPSYFFDTLF